MLHFYVSGVKIALCIMSWCVYGVVYCGPGVVSRFVPESPGPLYSPRPPWIQGPELKAHSHQGQ